MIQLVTRDPLCTGRAYAMLCQTEWCYSELWKAVCWTHTHILCFDNQAVILNTVFTKKKEMKMTKGSGTLLVRFYSGQKGKLMIWVKIIFKWLVLIGHPGGQVLCQYIIGLVFMGSAPQCTGHGHGQTLSLGDQDPSLLNFGGYE